uniref:hypothetical protein n=1 Tax=Pseudomonas sp. TaxID=306 RepID=UPI00159EBD9C|nr:hypothetical protein [Pseudomonas sp.]
MAEWHGITIDELSLAADQLIAERGHLLAYEEPVLAWPKACHAANNGIYGKSGQHQSSQGAARADAQFPH